MADGDLYKPTVGTTVSTTTWQISSDNGGSWVNAPSNTPPNTTNDVFLNGISLTVDANLSFKTLRNTTTYNKNQTAVSMQSVSNLTAGGKLILTGSYTLTGSATAHGDLALDGNNCISGGSANALIDNTGQVGTQTITLSNVRVKAGTATTHHSFNVVSTAAMIFNCSNNCRFQGAVSTAACHGFNTIVNCNITFSGDVEFKGGDVASSYGLNVPSNATIKINNTSTTQVKMTGGTQSGCFGVSLTAGGSTITIGDIATSDLNYLITAGSGATSYGLNITNLNTGSANINIGVPTGSSNATNVVVSSSTSPAIYCSSLIAPIVIYRGTIKTTSNGWQPIATLSKLFILGSNAVLVEFPTATGSASFTTNASVSNVTEASIWSYATRVLTAATNITSDGATISQTQLGRLDATVSSRLATSGYTAPDNSSITAIKAKTDNLPSDPASNTQVNTRLASASYTAPDNATISTINTNVSAIKTKTDNLPANTETQLTTIQTATDRIPTNPASVQSTGDQIATLQ